MDNLVTELYQILQQQLEAYRQMLALAEKKQPVLIEGKIEELAKITQEEENLIFQVGRLEEKRNSVHQALANHFLLSPKDLNAVELEKRLKEETAKDFRTLFAEMGTVIKELDQVNKTNTEMIQQSLNYVNFTLGVLTNVDNTPSYDEKDERKADERARIFDQKI